MIRLRYRSDLGTWSVIHLYSKFQNIKYKQIKETSYLSLLGGQKARKIRSDWNQTILYVCGYKCMFFRLFPHRSTKTFVTIVEKLRFFCRAYGLFSIFLQDFSVNVKNNFNGKNKGGRNITTFANKLIGQRKISQENVFPKSRQIFFLCLFDFHIVSPVNHSY